MSLKINYKTKHQALINKINKYSKKKEPFFFLISYNLSSYKIISLNKLNKQKNNIKIFIDKKNNFLNIKNLLNYKHKHIHKQEQMQNKTMQIKINFLKQSINLYKTKFKQIIENIKKGNIYICNLTIKTKLKSIKNIINKSNKKYKTKKQNILKKIFYNSYAKYKIYYKNKFISFSPETFIQIKKDKIYSFPMKGTISTKEFKGKSQTIKENKAKKTLLANKKELAEHFMIVDLIRNDLSIMCKNIIVDSFRYIQKIKLKNNVSKNNNVLYQTSSKISATLPKNWHKNLGNIIGIL
jgi:para-aminobenzoate synthetase component 1